MKNYEVTSRMVELSSGKLRLSAVQAAARAHLLTPLGGDLYELRDKTQFKKGEKFGYDGQLSKALAQETEVLPKNAKPSRPNEAIQPKASASLIARLTGAGKKAEEKTDAPQPAAANTAEPAPASSAA